jgi:TIR domain
MVTLYEFSYHCFLSYTTREEEVREVQPRVDELIERFTNYGYQVAPIFYDHYIFGLRTPSNLRAALSRANHESAFMVILVSPGYFTSPWCIFDGHAWLRLRRGDKIELSDTILSGYVDELTHRSNS